MATYTHAAYECLNCDNEKDFLRRYQNFLKKIYPNKGRNALKNREKIVKILADAKINYKVN